MAAKEAKARIKINKLLEKAGWRFDGAGGKANVVLEPNVELSCALVDAFGDNVEVVSRKNARSGEFARPPGAKAHISVGQTPQTFA